MPSTSPLPEHPSRSLSARTELRPEDASSLAADEQAYEALQEEERKETFLEHAEGAPTSQTGVQGSATDEATASALQPKDEVVVELEKILEDGLGDYVAAMPEEARTRFLYKGQETATAISLMVRALKVHAKKVVELIRNWLLTIPGVNKFFLEQEAKIKTDRVLELEKTYREQTHHEP